MLTLGDKYECEKRNEKKKTSYLLYEVSFLSQSFILKQSCSRVWCLHYCSAVFVCEQGKQGGQQIMEQETKEVKNTEEYIFNSNNALLISH